MKQLIFILLICLFPYSVQAENILLFEYKEGGCYYILELDTLHKDGRFYAYSCFNEIYLIDIQISLNKVEDERIVYTPYYYEHWDSDLNWKFGLTADDPFNIDGFIFWYDVKNNWQRLEYGYFHFDEEIANAGNFSYLNKETMMLSPFFEQYGISWFPPYMESTKKINLDRFPEEFRKKIEKGRLK